MPKDGPTDGVMSGLFAIKKPSGRITMDLLNALQPLLTSSPLFHVQNNNNDSKGKRSRRGPYSKANRVKLGQAGTLDPLASGVLVLGINKGTKHLSALLEGQKEYKTTGILGAATDSYDSEGKITRRRPHKHVTKESIGGVLDRFRGSIQQMPPIFSALKMDGKALHEYARSNTPLPRPIQPRACTIYNLQLDDWQESAAHKWKFPTAELPEVEQRDLEWLEKQATEKSPEVLAETTKKGEENPTGKETPTEKASANQEESQENTPTEAGPSFSLTMRVSSGTYVRSIVHDIGNAVESAAHVVQLIRTRQGDFVLDPTEADLAEGLRPCIDWEILQDAIDKVKQGLPVQTTDDGRPLWEKAIVDNMKVV